MPDDLGQRGPPDRKRINVNETWELNWWAKELGVSPAEVISAVRAVGPMAADVRRHLRR
jgi:hypothetical protein